VGEGEKGEREWGVLGRKLGRERREGTGKRGLMGRKREWKEGRRGEREEVGEWGRRRGALHPFHPPPLEWEKDLGGPSTLPSTLVAVAYYRNERLVADRAEEVRACKISLRGP
jgi:hypothetical protein